MFCGHEICIVGICVYLLLRKEGVYVENVLLFRSDGRGLIDD